MRRFLVMLVVACLFAAQAWAATFTSKATGNFSADGQTTWNEAGSPQTGDTVTIGTHTVTLDQDFTGTVNGSSTGTLLVSGTRAIVGNITYSGTGTGGLITFADANAVLNHTGKTTNSSTGYCIVLAAGAYNVTNTNACCLTGTNAGRPLHQTSGTSTITGGSTADTNAAVYHNATYAIYMTGGTCTINGRIHSVTQASGSYPAWVAGSTAILDLTACDLASSDVGANSVIHLGSGLIIWTGNHAIASGQNAIFRVGGGVLRLTDLTLANSGRFVIIKYAGTLTTTNATITNQAATAQAAILGATVAVTGPTLPTAAAVKAGTTFGYAGGILTGTFHGDPVAY